MKKVIRYLLGLFYYYLYGKYKNSGNRVILYHSIGSTLEHDTYGISISKENFKKHLLFLKEHYKIIPIDEKYYDTLDQKTLTITFDDGYKDNLFALSLCEEYNIPFILYITTGMIGKEDYLTKDEIQKFAKSSVCTLGTHSVTHPHLEKLSFEEQLFELKESKNTLEEIIGEGVIHMSYPNGSFNKDTLEILKQLDYKYIGSSEIGLNTKQNYDYRFIRRSEIIASDSIKELQRKVDGFYDYLALKNRVAKDMM